MINNICDHCLVVGYADQVRRIDRKVADEAIRYFGKPAGTSRRQPERSNRRTLVWLSGAGAAAAAALLALQREVGHVLGSYSAHLMDWARSMRDMVSR
jgi:uncharacterized heparinase superfamily protein